MGANVDPQMVLLIGSETRAAVLTVLANANGPLSGYRIAATGRVAQPKVHLQLHRLQDAGFVDKKKGGWVLMNPSVRSLFNGRMPVQGWDDWAKEHHRRELAGAELIKVLRDLPHARPPKGWIPRNPAQYIRPPMKDRMNRRLGLAESHHGGR
jgi:DNA-binding transcriptional ArsR family regulator